MSIKIVCQWCGKKLGAPVHFAGKTCVCPYCKQPVKIPEASPLQQGLPKVQPVPPPPPVATPVTPQQVPPQAVAAVQQIVQVKVVAGGQKSVAAAFLLAMFFGPLGMLYSTVAGCLMMILLNILIVLPTAGLGLLITQPLCVLWAVIAASSYNRRLANS